MQAVPGLASLPEICKLSVDEMGANYGACGDGTAWNGLAECGVSLRRWTAALIIMGRVGAQHLHIRIS